MRLQLHCLLLNKMNMVYGHTKRLNFIRGCVFLIVLGLSTSLASALPESPLAIQSLQTRSYEQYDKRQLFNASVMTLQDMGFIVEQSDFNGGFISARNGGVLTTVTVVQANDDSVRVRINSNANVDNVSTYQYFFVGIEQNLFTADIF